jgi:hypothetical protein
VFWSGPYRSLFWLPRSASGPHACCLSSCRALPSGPVTGPLQVFPGTEFVRANLSEQSGTVVAHQVLMPCEKSASAFASFFSSKRRHMLDGSLIFVAMSTQITSMKLCIRLRTQPAFTYCRSLDKHPLRSTKQLTQDLDQLHGAV